ncbi:hypothetical protein CRUP_016853 [Coryphaenoides rupestris]|nr:hypothetical protein CRUP_016853 [Coryphaenoides rupestris]
MPRPLALPGGWPACPAPCPYLACVPRPLVLPGLRAPPPGPTWPACHAPWSYLACVPRPLPLSGLRAPPPGPTWPACPAPWSYLACVPRPLVLPASSGGDGHHTGTGGRWRRREERGGEEGKRGRGGEEERGGERRREEEIGGDRRRRGEERRGEGRGEREAQGAEQEQGGREEENRRRREREEQSQQGLRRRSSCSTRSSRRDSVRQASFITRRLAAVLCFCTISTLGMNLCVGLGMRNSPGISTSAVCAEKLLRKRHFSSMRKNLGSCLVLASRILIHFFSLEIRLCSFMEPGMMKSKSAGGGERGEGGEESFIVVEVEGRGERGVFIPLNAKIQEDSRRFIRPKAYREGPSSYPDWIQHDG